MDDSGHKTDRMTILTYRRLYLLQGRPRKRYGQLKLSLLLSTLPEGIMALVRSSMYIGDIRMKSRLNRRAIRASSTVVRTSPTVIRT